MSRPHCGHSGSSSGGVALSVSISAAAMSRWQPSHCRPLRRATATPPNVLRSASYRSRRAAGIRSCWKPLGDPRVDLLVDRRQLRRQRRVGGRHGRPQGLVLRIELGGLGVETFLRLEVLELGVVELGVTTLDRGDLVHQRLRLPGHDHCAPLLLETNLFGAEVGTGRFLGSNLARKLVELVADLGAPLLRSGEGAVGGGDRVVFGSVGPPVAELVEPGVGALQVEQIVESRHGSPSLPDRRPAGLSTWTRSR